MTKYKCRLLASSEPWFEISANTPEEAAQDYFFDIDCYTAIFWYDIHEGKKEQIRFAVIEVENHGEFVCRVYRSGIWRKGRELKPEVDRLRELAGKLGWTKDPRKLIEPGWDYESPDYTK